MKVFVYFNLHKRCFSVKALEGDRKGRVVAHVNDAIIYEPTFKVSQAGRQRVLRERKKNVHAGVVGKWFENEHNPARSVELLSLSGRAITYNPYKFSEFVYRTTETPVDSNLRCAILHSDGQRATIHAIN